MTSTKVSSYSRALSLEMENQNENLSLQDAEAIYRLPMERLMCVWQAAYYHEYHLRQDRVTSSPKIETLHRITSPISDKRAKLPPYQPTEQPVNFQQFRDHVSGFLNGLGEDAKHDFLEEIEEVCWVTCKSYVSSRATNEAELKKLWRIFNRIADVGTYPPKCSRDGTTWFCGYIARALRKSWNNYGGIPEDGLTFQALISDLDYYFFEMTGTVAVRQCVNHLYERLVLRVLKTGWLHKRTRKNANWTNQLRRWFVMSDGKIEYFEGPEQKSLKKSHHLTSGCQVEDVPDSKSKFSKNRFRFKLRINPLLEIEMSTEDADEKKDWMEMFKVNIEATTQCVSPETIIVKRNSKELFSEQGHDLPTSIEHIHLDDIPAMFEKADKNKNGRIDKDEFCELIKDFGVAVTEQVTDVLFQTVDKSNQGYMNYEQFSEFFMSLAMGDMTQTRAEVTLRAAFLKADKNGSGKLNFREFAEYAWSVRRSYQVTSLLRAFEDMEDETSGELDFENFKQFFSFLHNDSDVSVTDKHLETYLKKFCEDVSDVKVMVRHMRSRLGTIRMNTQLSQALDRLRLSSSTNLQYELLELACYNDLAVEKPQKVNVKVKWSTAANDLLGKCILDQKFDGKLPIESATKDKLAYYGANLLDNEQLKFALLYKQSMQDFTQENAKVKDEFSKRGLVMQGCFERHDCPQVLCSLEQESGFIVLAKEDDTNCKLDLTAFNLSSGQTLYFPGGTLHSKSSMKGTWRTMLPDEYFSDHYYLLLQGGEERTLAFQIEQM